MSRRLLQAFTLALPSAASTSLLIVGFVVGEGLLAAAMAAEDATGGLVLLLAVDVDGLQPRLPVWAPMAKTL
jgi:hypothetical protein